MKIYLPAIALGALALCAEAIDKPKMKCLNFITVAPQKASRGRRSPLFNWGGDSSGSGDDGDDGSDGSDGGDATTQEVTTTMEITTTKRVTTTEPGTTTVEGTETTVT